MIAMIRDMIAEIRGWIREEPESPIPLLWKRAGTPGDWPERWNAYDVLTATRFHPYGAVLEISARKPPGLPKAYLPLIDGRYQPKREAAVLTVQQTLGDAKQAVETHYQNYLRQSQ